MRKFSSYVIAAAVVLALALCPVAARADQTQLSLSYVIPDQYTNPGNFGTVFTGPYATVTVDWINSTTANITFASSGSYYMGDGGSAALNVNGSFSLSNFVDTCGSGCGWDGSQLIYPGGTGIDGSSAGTFNLLINNTGGNLDGYKVGLVQTISFTLTDTSGKG